MDVSLAVTTLQLFNEKADKLERLSFTRSLENSGVTISARQDQPVQLQRYGPDDESIDAFVLTMRFFVQDNETTSFHNMAGLYARLPVAADLAKKFNDARDKTNISLDKRTPINLNNVDLTYRAVFEVFLWGGLAHANPTKKRVYDSWVRDQILFSLLQNEFIVALAIILNMIFFTRAVNKAALTQLRQQT
ncbi:MAG: hypothetical protein ABID84_04010 [Chloroflexota bacterium]